MCKVCLKERVPSLSLEDVFPGYFGSFVVFCNFSTPVFVYGFIIGFAWLGGQDGNQHIET